MYEQHFGLQRHPFTARASGADVFVGPQTAATMAGLKKALQSPDAVVAVFGPAGAGKSTLVGKALDAIADSHRSVRIGRLSLDGADALEFLLEELGVTELPRGTIRQFAALREQLAQLEAEGKRLVIVVEDAVLTGVDTMAELEALTAADAGESGGAAIVVMGDERLDHLLQDCQLARLAQRIRQRQEILPLSPAELRGYLAHCFRQSGGQFEEIFDADAAVVIHDLCNGNPRIANNLVDAVLAAAASSGMSPVASKFIAEVGSNQLGLVASGKLTAEPPAEPEPLPIAEPAAEPEPLPIAEPAPTPEPEPAAEMPELDVDPGEDFGETAAVASDKPEPEEHAEPVIVFSDEPGESVLGEDDLPELIQDTLPDLEVLVPEVMEPAVTPEPAITPEPPASSQPEPAALPESTADDVPEWERDPTMAELKPDLEALEKAMAFAHGDDDIAGGEPPVLEPLAKSEPEAPAADIEEIPEITLDNAIQQRIEDSLIDEPGSVSAAGDTPPSTTEVDLPEVRIPARNAKKADQELELIAAELAKAKTIEDVDDKLAETLFGEEFNLVAAQVVASGSAGANDGEMALFDTGAAALAQAAGTPVTEDMAFDEPAIEVSLDSNNDSGEGGLDLSASQRLKTVRSLHSDPQPSVHDSNDGPDSANDVSASNAATPEPIEDQINTSMTQTLKALNVRPPISNHDDDIADDDIDNEKKGGFFSRFRRS